MTKLIHILNGPNLNLLGTREPEIYGTDTLADIRVRCEQLAADLGLQVHFAQTNHEGVLIDQIHSARDSADALILNAAAFTHTSIALLDALKTLTIPVFEVHLSNPATREHFRHHSHVSGQAVAVIAGLGGFGYEVALQGVALRLGVASK